jgi:hypothetical protein
MARYSSRFEPLHGLLLSFAMRRSGVRLPSVPPSFTVRLRRVEVEGNEELAVATPSSGPSRWCASWRSPAEAAADLGKSQPPAADLAHVGRLFRQSEIGRGGCCTELLVNWGVGEPRPSSSNRRSDRSHMAQTKGWLWIPGVRVCDSAVR